MYGLVTTLEVRGLWTASYPIVDNMWIQKAVLWAAICRPEQEFYRTDWCTLQYACYLHSVEQNFYNDWFMAIFEHWKDLLRRTVRSARFALVVFQGISIQNLKSFLYCCTKEKVRNINLVRCQKFILQTSWWRSFSERLLKEVSNAFWKLMRCLSANSSTCLWDQQQCDQVETSQLQIPESLSMDKLNGHHVRISALPPASNLCHQLSHKKEDALMSIVESIYHDLNFLTRLNMESFWNSNAKGHPGLKKEASAIIYIHNWFWYCVILLNSISIVLCSCSRESEL